MRDFARFVPTFWTRGTGKELRGDPPAQTLASYLMTSPHSNMIGIYYLPISYIVEETGLPAEEVRRCLGRFAAMQWAWYDEEDQIVFVRRMVAYQVGERLSEKDKNVVSVRRELAKYRTHFFAAAFYDLYGASHHLGGHFPDIVKRFPNRELVQAAIEAGTIVVDDFPPKADESRSYCNSLQPLTKGFGRASYSKETIREEQQQHSSASAREDDPTPDPEPLPDSGPDNPDAEAVLVALQTAPAFRVDMADDETVEMVLGRMYPGGKALAWVLRAIADAGADIPSGSTLDHRRRTLRKYVDHARPERIAGGGGGKREPEPPAPAMPPPRPMQPPPSLATRELEAEAKAAGGRQ